MSGFIYLILLCALIWFWLDSRRAHEFAVDICRHLCSQHDVLLLDDTIALHRLKLRRANNGHIQFERSYRFEYSDNPGRRDSGDLVLLGLRPVEVIIHGQRTLL